jgi:hypothetical protein
MLERSWSPTAGWSASIWIIVGTSRALVTPCSWMAASTEVGSNIGTTTCVPPTIDWAAHAARSARWNMGAAWSSVPPGITNG